MSGKKYKKQIDLNRKKYAREELVDVEIRLRNKKTGKRRTEQLEEETIRKAMNGDDDSIVVVSLFLKKKIKQDERLFYANARDSTGRLKAEKSAPVNRGAIGEPLAQFVTATMISACHKKKKLMPPALYKLMLLILGDETFYAKYVESYPKKRRARDFAVAFPSASLRQIANYAGRGTSPNSAKTWCVRKAENLLDRIATDPDRASMAGSIEAECKALGLQIPKDDPTKKKGIYELLKKEMSRRGEKKAKKASCVDVQSESV